MEKTFNYYLESKGQSRESIKVHYRHLSYFLNYCEDQNIEADQASYSEILGYIAYLQKKPLKNKTDGLKQRTLQFYIGSLHHYFIWLIKTEKREDNPTRNIDIKGIKRRMLYDLLSRQELESLYHNFQITSEDTLNKNQNWFKTSLLTSKRNRVILGMMIYQGLGSMHLSRLQMEDLKLRDGKVYIPSTRRSNERELKLESVQVMDLMEYTLKTREDLLALSGKESDMLFVSSGSSDRFANMMQNLMKRLRRQKPKVSSLKQIRTSVITYWLKNHNLREVQYMAGHRYVSSTEGYLINDLDDLQEDIAKFHPIG
jgi:integrase/recombinase XerD